MADAVGLGSTAERCGGSSPPPCTSLVAVVLLVGAAGCTTSGVAGADARTPCDGQPVPPHGCAGGEPVPRCNASDDGRYRWQIDCGPFTEASSKIALCGVSPCEPAACGPEPSWNDDECVYGFAGTEGTCDRFDHGPCTWNRRCLPKPCSEAEGTCNVLDRSRLGRPCGRTEGDDCPSGSTCASIAVSEREHVDPVCIEGDPCTALTCAPGRRCRMAASYPGQLGCSSTERPPGEPRCDP